MKPSDEELRPGPARTSHGIRGVASFVILAVAFVLAGRYLRNEQDAISHLTATDPLLLVAMAGLLAACMVLNGLVTRDVVACFGIRLRVREWMGVTLVTSMLNLVTPGRGGTAVRALYLKRAHGLQYAQFAGTLAATLGFTLTANAGLGAVALLLLGIPGGASGWLALGTCVAIMLSLVAAIVFARYADGDSASESTAVLPRVIRGWRTIAADRVLLTRLALWNLINAVAHAAAFAVAFSSAGASGSHLAAVVSSAFAKMGAVVAITPAALGIFEAFGVVSARIVGEELAASLLAVLLVRIVSVFLILIGGGIMWYTIMAGDREQRPPGVDVGRNLL